MLEVLLWELGYVGFKIDKDKRDKKGEFWFNLNTDSVRGIVTNTNNKICLDRVDTFNKASDCPIQLPIPSTLEQVNFIVNKIKWLSTDEWYDISNELDSYSWITEYPQEMRDVQNTELSRQIKTNRRNKNSVHVRVSGL